MVASGYLSVPVARRSSAGGGTSAQEVNGCRGRLLPKSRGPADRELERRGSASPVPEAMISGKVLLAECP